MVNARQGMFHKALKSIVTDWYWETVPCTRQQLDACEAAWKRLAEECWDEQALTVLNVLFATAKAHKDGWDWMTTELYFEAYAFALNNRAQAALHYSQLTPDVTADGLDRYNQRLQRF